MRAGESERALKNILKENTAGLNLIQHGLSKVPGQHVQSKACVCEYVCMCSNSFCTGA